MTTGGSAPTQTRWYAVDADDAATRLGVDPAEGLGSSAAASLLDRHGPNALPVESPPSLWAVGRRAASAPTCLTRRPLVSTQWHSRAQWES